MCKYYVYLSEYQTLYKIWERTPMSLSFHSYIRCVYLYVEEIRIEDFKILLKSLVLFLFMQSATLLL